MENSVSMTWTEEVEAGSSDNVSYRERWGGTDEALLVCYSPPALWPGICPWPGSWGLLFKQCYSDVGLEEILPKYDKC